MPMHRSIAWERQVCRGSAQAGFGECFGRGEKAESGYLRGKFSQNLLMS
ncbi:hypothetical protein JM93_01311 [Roseibium hamelinense]|uniref:Uncharacterized protein n=1 Tax=Roseibium hamelinense TaxID=150831 RepID=A0A562TBS2_9HYPH|nr:hypothetical protein JM93_01311 [Roseibium hamelinense]